MDSATSEGHHEEWFGTGGPSAGGVPGGGGPSGAEAWPDTAPTDLPDPPDPADTTDPTAPTTRHDAQDPTDARDKNDGNGGNGGNGERDRDRDRDNRNDKGSEDGNRTGSAPRHAAPSLPGGWSGPWGPPDPGDDTPPRGTPPHGTPYERPPYRAPARAVRDGGTPLTPEHPAHVPLDGPRFLTEPDTLYRELRQEHGNVVPVRLTGEVPAWLVIGYRELHQVTGDPALFSRDPGLWSQWERIPGDWPLLPVIGLPERSILSTVGERHREHADMVGSALSAVDPFALRGYVERFADELIDAVCERGEADLVADYAVPLPARTLAFLLGIPAEQVPGLVEALQDITEGRERARAAHSHLSLVLRRLVAARRRAPEDDVTSRMLADARGFTDREITRDLMVVLAAGHQPTADWIGNSLRLMLTDERFAASLLGGRSSVAEAMNEVLWEDSPTQNVAGRWAARDTRLGGRRIRAGDLLLLGLQGANSDPRIRAEGPALTGGNSAHFSFGHGEHRCPFPAQEVAEIIARTGTEVVLDRLPDIDLAEPEDSLTRRSNPWLRGFARLPVRFTPTPPLGT